MNGEERLAPTEELRARAVSRLKKQHDFRMHLMIYVLFNAMFVAIWAMTGTPFFWPVIPMVLWGVGVVANAWDAYGRDVPTESEIRHEMEKLSRNE
jgi:hypothetical protein